MKFSQKWGKRAHEMHWFSEKREDALRGNWTFDLLVITLLHILHNWTSFIFIYFQFPSLIACTYTAKTSINFCFASFTVEIYTFSQLVCVLQFDNLLIIFNRTQHIIKNHSIKGTFFQIVELVIVNEYSVCLNENYGHFMTSLY